MTARVLFACLFACLCCSAPTVAQDKTAAPKPNQDQRNQDSVGDSAQDDTTAWQTQVRQVLAMLDGDKVTPAKRDAMYNELMKLKPNSTEAAQLQLSFAILSANQKRYADALKMTGQVLSANENDICARALQARLLMLTNKFTQAIVELERIVDALASGDAEGTIPQKEHAARLVGLATGYFTGPGEQTVRSTALTELKRAGERIPEPMNAAFESAKLAIAEEYRLMKEEGEAALKAHREKLEKEASELRKQLDDERARAKSEAEYARSELQTNFGMLQQNWQQAWAACQALQAQGDVLWRRETSLQLQLAAIPPPRTDSQGRPDPNDTARYAAEAAALQNAIGAVNWELANVASRYSNARSQGMLIERQMQGLQNRAQQLGMNLAMQSESFNRLDAAIRQKEADATNAAPKKKTAAQIRAERAFSLYDDFNPHKEKKLLLDAMEQAQ